MRSFEPYPNVHDSVKCDRGILKNVYSWPENSFENLLCWHYQSLTPFQKRFPIFGTLAKRFPLKWSLVEDVECPIKERKRERKEKEAGKKRKRTLTFCAFLEKMPHSYYGPNADLSLNAWFKPNVQQKLLHARTCTTVCSGESRKTYATKPFTCESSLTCPVV